MTYFHFTSMHHLPTILVEGLLRPTESNIGSPVNFDNGLVGSHAGPPVVWLLDLPDIDGPDMTHGLYEAKRQVRFEVDVKAIRWLDWAPGRAMSPAWRDIFMQYAGGVEAAAHWYVYPAPIRSKRWVRIDDLVSGQQIATDAVVEIDR